MKINKKRITLILLILIVLIGILVIVFNSSDKDSTNSALEEGSQNEIDAENNSVADNSNVTTNETTSQDNTSSTSVPQQETTSVSDFVDDNGNVLEGDDLQAVKDNIINVFKTVSLDKLGLNIDLDGATFVFNQGTTQILDVEFFVFSVYYQQDSSYRNVGMYAMSKDTTILYKFNTDTMCYDLIEM